jgi:hypothetical protein
LTGKSAAWKIMPGGKTVKSRNLRKRGIFRNFNLPYLTRPSVTLPIFFENGEGRKGLGSPDILAGL